MLKMKLHWQILIALGLAVIAGMLAGKHASIFGVLFYDIFNFVGTLFLNALKMYKVDVGILLGDLCGKMINPIIKQPDGTHLVHLLGEHRKLANDEELQAAKKELAAMGNYYIMTDPEEVEALKAEGKTVHGRIDERATEISLSAGKVEELFRNLVLERLESWMRLAEERLDGSNIQMFMAPGNDDIPETDAILNDSKYIVNADDRKVDINGF